MNTYLLFCFAFVSVGIARGQSTLTEFDLLKKQREVAAEKAIAPIRAKFAAEAETLIAKAIQAGDLATAEKVRREFPNGTQAGTNAPSPKAAAINLDAYLQSRKWQWNVSRSPHLGTSLEFLPNGRMNAPQRPDDFVSWEVIGTDQIRVVLKPNRAVVLRFDPAKDRFSDGGTIALESKSKG